MKQAIPCSNTHAPGHVPILLTYWCWYMRGRLANQLQVPQCGVIMNGTLHELLLISPSRIVKHPVGAGAHIVKVEAPRALLIRH